MNVLSTFRGSALVVVCTLVDVLTGTLGHAAEIVPEIHGHTGQSQVEIIGLIKSGPETRRAGQGARAEITYLPACQGNVPDTTSSKDASCPQALAMCASTPAADDLMFWRFERMVGPPPGPWRRTGGSCLRPAQVPGVTVPGFTLADFRRLPLPAGGVHVQPGTLRTLVNVETNVYVSAGPVTLTTTVVGRPVRVRATPVGFRWSFGDGGVLATTDPGGEYPAMTTTHVYRRPGVVLVGLTTRYRGAYSVAGGPWLPVDGEAEVASAPVRLTVVQARAELVADPLP